MKIFRVYFAHIFCTGTLGAAQLRTGTSSRWATIIFVIRASNSTRESVIFADFEEKGLHVILYVKRLSLIKVEKFLSVGILPKVKNYVRVQKLCVRKNLLVRKKNLRRCWENLFDA